MKDMKKLKFKIISLFMSKDKQAVASTFMFIMVKRISLLSCLSYYYLSSSCFLERISVPNESSGGGARGGT